MYRAAKIDGMSWRKEQQGLQEHTEKAWRADHRKIFISDKPTWLIASKFLATKLLCQVLRHD